MEDRDLGHQDFDCVKTANQYHEQNQRVCHHGMQSEREQALTLSLPDPRCSDP